jgi:hypothetical protein
MGGARERKPGDLVSGPLKSRSQTVLDGVQINALGTEVRDGKWRGQPACLASLRETKRHARPRATVPSRARTYGRARPRRLRDAPGRNPRTPPIAKFKERPASKGRVHKGKTGG